ncbi:MAG: ABC transporter permease [Clostridia bacterium]|nr:ABC transporter permease [Clostridia bacterium]
MKMGDIRYLTKEGIKNTWANRLMTLASIGVLVACMVVIGLAVLISENGNKALGDLEKQNVVIAYMKDYSWALYGRETDDTKTSDSKAEEAKTNDTSTKQETDDAKETDDAAATETPDENGIKQSDYYIHNDEEAKELCRQIEKIDNVKKVEFISSAEGLKTVTEKMFKEEEQYFSFLNDDNPLPCAAKITMNSMEKFDATIRKIENMQEIDIVRSQADSAKKIVAIKNGVQVAGMWMVSILLLISLVIVSNTIRITMYSRKLEISIMKAVGATNAFVRLPFVVEGVTIGLISALISEGLLYFCYRVVTEKISNIIGTTVIPFSEMALTLLGIFAAIGIVSGILGSSIMISKYLRKEGSEFAAI